MIAKVLACSVLVSSMGMAQAEIIERKYEDFTLWVDCDEKAAIQYAYLATKDGGSKKRHSRFYFDPNTPERCRQHSKATYKAPTVTYDRGHQVPANHLDHSELAIKQSNYMVNVWPQTRQLNRGAMYHTEKIIECYRDHSPVVVYGGVIMGTDSSDDYFVESHGVKTPSGFWKVIYNKDSLVAWIFPNTKAPTARRIDRYIVTVKEIEKEIGRSLPVPAHFKSLNLNHSWPLPKGCDYS